MYRKYHLIIRLTALMGLLSPLQVGAYEVDAPKFITVRLEYEHPKTGASSELNAQMWFEDDALPVFLLTDEGIERPRKLNAKRLVPKTPGDFLIERTDQRHKGAPVHTFTNYQGKTRFRFANDRIPFVASGDPVGGVIKEPDASELDSLELENLLRLGTEGDEPDSLLGEDRSVRVTSVRFVVAKEHVGLMLPTSNIKRITFLKASGGYTFEKYRGRYLQFSKAGRGDEGRVQVAAATFFGGEDAEAFDAGAFMSDGTIVLVASAASLDHLGFTPIRVLGKDSGMEEIPVRYRRTPVMIRYSADLSRILDVVRLPWGAGKAYGVFFGEDDALFLAMLPGPSFKEYAKTLDNVKKAGDPMGGRMTSFLLRIDSEWKGVDWAVEFENVKAGMVPYLKEHVLAQYGETGLQVDMKTGATQPGPVVKRVGGGTRASVVHPETGEFFFGGENHSATGLEPWRSPWLRKFGSDGEIDWTAYNWTGPIVGTTDFRLVSDSAVVDLNIGGDGNLLITGWSDGGNSVFTRQPYDLRKGVPQGGWCSSIWGARVLSVPYLIRMDAQTMDVYGMTRYNSYLPTDDRPNSIKINAVTTTEKGDVAVFGSSAFGFVETQDAWVTPWIVEHRTDEFARAKGGNFLTLFRPDLRSARLATILPGMTKVKLATRGDYLLVYGEAKASTESYGRTFETIVKDAVQSDYGGGASDAYVMLVNTQGEPQPVTLPAWTWGKNAGKSSPKR